MRNRIRAWLLRREARRPIPASMDWYMTDTERLMWNRYGWRVTYWVCPKCGVRRDGYPMWNTFFGGWMIPALACNCAEVK